MMRRIIFPFLDGLLVMGAFLIMDTVSVIVMDTVSVIVIDAVLAIVIDAVLAIVIAAVLVIVIDAVLVIVIDAVLVIVIDAELIPMEEGEVKSLGLTVYLCAGFLLMTDYVLIYTWLKTIYTLQSRRVG